MSGIFKSVKKVFRNIGKFFKKYWKAIVIAAAVYFGGAYLMARMGGAGAAAQSALGLGEAYSGMGVGQRVGGAFRHSGNIWRNALSSMLKGGSATASASAYSQAVVGMSGRSISSQVAAGTSAVQSLNWMRNVAQVSPFSQGHINDAAADGIAAGKVYANNAQLGHPKATELAQGKLTELLSAKESQLGIEAEAPMAAPDVAPVAQKEVPTTLVPQTMATEEDDTVAPDAALGLPSLGMEGAAPEIPRYDAEAAGKSVVSGLQEPNTYQTMMMEYLKGQSSYNRLALGMQGVGMLTKAFGAYSTAQAEEEDLERIRTKKIPKEWQGDMPGVDWSTVKI